MKISTSSVNNLLKFKQMLNLDSNFDIILKEFKILDRNAFLLTVDGFTKGESLQKILEAFNNLNGAYTLTNVKTFVLNSLPYYEVTTLSDEKEIMQELLSGVTIIFVDGFTEALAVDVRQYPQRITSEPKNDKVFRGAHDGFVETLIFNCALIRRRIRDPRLCFLNVKVGCNTKTEVAICYLKGKADEALVCKVQNALVNAKVKAIEMNQEDIARVISPSKWYNPFPKFKFSERPDTACAEVLEGQIIVLIDNSPACIVLPTTLLDILEEANDYYFPPITSTYLKLTRLIVIILTIFGTPLFLLLINNPEYLPSALSFMQIKGPIHVPILLQFILLEVATDGLRLASLNTPNMLSGTLSILGAVVVGEFATKSGWLNEEPLLYMCIVTLASYSQPSFELGYGFKFMRVILLIATGVFGVYGFALSSILVFILICSNTNIDGRSFLYPLLPLDYAKLSKKFFKFDSKGN
ncbi:MAG: spore germination protein [Clostridia bacterium]